MTRLCQVRNRTKDTSIGSRIEVATTQKTRLVGLLGRAGLEPEEGLWIRPSNGVHTFGMRFAIDVIGLDREQRVVKLWNELAPQRLTALYWKVQSVLELPAGTIYRTRAELGDALEVTLFQLG